METEDSQNVPLENDIPTVVDYIDSKEARTEIDSKEGENKEKTVPEPVKKRGRGRPRKTEIEARKKPGKVGRPAGDAAAIKEYKARLLASPKSRKVLDSILNAALDDEHKNQAAAWKLLVDRLMPISYFEKDKGDNGRSSVSITISGVGGETINIGGSESKHDDFEDYIDGEILDDKR